MPKILCTTQANLDLVEIALTLARENPAAAGRWLDRIQEKYAMLARMPLLGHERSDLAPHLRSLTTGHYVIFYRPQEDGIQIIRVLHGARDIPRFVK